MINLLKVKPGSEETKLTGYFQESLKHAVSKDSDLAALQLSIINHDFHGGKFHRSKIVGQSNNVTRGLLAGLAWCRWLLSLRHLARRR